MIHTKSGTLPKAHQEVKREKRTCARRGAKQEEKTKVENTKQAKRKSSDTKGKRISLSIRMCFDCVRVRAGGRGAPTLLLPPFCCVYPIFSTQHTTQPPHPNEKKKKKGEACGGEGKGADLKICGEAPTCSRAVQRKQTNNNKNRRQRISG